MFPINHITCEQTWDVWAKKHPEIVNRKRKLILKQGQSPGDIVIFTKSVGDLKTSYPNYIIDVRSPAPEIWENSPYLTPLKDDDPEVETFNIGYSEINESGWNGLHFADAFRHDLELQLKVPIKKTGFKPEIWISDEEKNWFNQVHCEFGWDGPYWIINAGRKQDNVLKQYHRYQESVDLLNEYFKGKVKIIQIGHETHIHPELKGVLNLVGKTSLREYIRLIYWAHGTIGPISMQMVISAAFEQPSVCIFGGKEGIKWQKYPHIKYLDTIGCLDCCKWDGCWLGGEKGECKDLAKTDKGEVPRCFEMIKPYMVADAVISYYEGGRLKIPSDEEYKKFQENIIKVAKEKIKDVQK